MIPKLKPLFIIGLLLIFNACEKRGQNKNMLPSSNLESKEQESKPTLQQDEKIPSYGSALDLAKFKQKYSEEKKALTPCNPEMD